MKEIFFHLHSLEGMALLMLVVHFLVLNHSAQYSWSVSSSKQQVSTKRKEHFHNYLCRSEVSKATHTNQYSNSYQHNLQELTHIYCAITIFSIYQDLGLMGFIFLIPCPHPSPCSQMLTVLTRIFGCPQCYVLGKKAKKINIQNSSHV